MTSDDGKNIYIMCSTLCYRLNYSLNSLVFSEIRYVKTLGVYAPCSFKFSPILFS